MIATAAALLSTLAASLFGAVGWPAVTGTVFVTPTVVTLPGGPSTAAAAHGNVVYLAHGSEILQLDLASDPAVTAAVAQLDADITAVAVDEDRLWVGDAGGVLAVFDRTANGALVEAGRIDVVPGGAASSAVTRIAIDGPRGFAAVAAIGLFIVDAGEGGVQLRASIDEPQMAPHLGAVDGTVFAWIAGRLALVDPRAPGPPQVRDVALQFDPGQIHHNLWGPDQFAVDPDRRQLVAVGGVVGWAGRIRSPAFAIAFDLDAPLGPREIGRAYPTYIDGHHVALGPAWAYFVSASYGPGSDNPTTRTVTAFERRGGLQRAQLWWRGRDRLGVPAPLVDGRIVVPLAAGGFVVLTPFVGGRVWLPVGWR